MKKTLTLLVVLTLAGAAYAQNDKPVLQPKTSADKAPAPAVSTAPAGTITPAKITITDKSTPMELAQAALAAHGGDKFKSFNSVLIRGSADLSAPGSTQTIPTTFLIVAAGDKSRFELNSPMAPVTQIFDGVNLYNSFPQIQIPPVARLTIPGLLKINDKTYTVSALADRKKKRGFRLLTPDGDATDFYIDPVTGLVDSVEARFMMNGKEVTTSIAHDKFRLVEGLMIPEKFTQRVEFGGMSAYASFKAKDILVNSELPENTFVIPQ